MSADENQPYEEPKQIPVGDEAVDEAIHDDQAKADEPVDEARMSLFEHLQELRVRLRNAAIGFILALGASFYFVEDLFEILVRPIKLAMIDLGVEPLVNQQGVGTGFWAYFKLSLIVGILFASPLIFWELWKFVAPGLYKKEKRLALLLTGATAFCFVGGAFFGYKMLAQTTAYYLYKVGKTEWTEQAQVDKQTTPAAPPVPTMMEVHTARRVELKAKLEAGSLTPAEKEEYLTLSAGIRPMLMVDEALDFQVMMLLGCGASFELPVVLSVLGWIGLISARGLWKFNKYALVLSAVVGGVLTPSPDMISQLMLAGPLYVLYNLSIIIIWFIERARKKKETELEGSAA